MKISDNYNRSLLLAGILLAGTLLLSACSSSQQSSSGSNMTSCGGGEVKMAATLNTSAVGIDKSQDYSAHYTLSASECQIVFSECPPSSTVSRTATVHLSDPPTPGKKITLTSPSVQGASYFDYSEFDKNTGSIRSWVASGTFIVTKQTEDELTIQADNLLMNPRPGIGSNKATGNFRLTLRGSALRRN